MKINCGKLHQAVECVLEKERWGFARTIADAIIEEKFQWQTPFGGVAGLTTT